jgi:3-hydroxybutyryl-CoA dehydrogenase
MKFDPIGVAGLGQLGRGIAACFLSRGYRVIAFDPLPAARERARSYIESALQELVRRAGFAETILNGWPSRFTEANSLAAFGPCRFVIESVIEDPAIKSQVFDEIEAVVSSDVPIGSNTSALPISLLQSTRKHSERFLGMHWNDPAYATRFLELVRGEKTSDAAFAAGVELASALDKEPALVRKDVPGFVANRLAYAMYREAVHLLETGVADVETIDSAFRNSVGLWASFCGPLRWIDITGGPWLYATAMKGVLPSLNNSADLPETLEVARRNKDFGTKNGRGFYSYRPGDAERWEASLREHAWRVSRPDAKKTE